MGLSVLDYLAPLLELSVLLAVQPFYDYFEFLQSLKIRGLPSSFLLILKFCHELFVDLFILHINLRASAHGHKMSCLNSCNHTKTTDQNNNGQTPSPRH